jgi:hypothetical protein
MSRNYATTNLYRVELVSNRDTERLTPASWYIRSALRQGRPNGYGAPTPANLRKYVQRFEASTKPGGANAHLGETRIVLARIVNQDTNETVAEYKPAMFEVVKTGS